MDLVVYVLVKEIYEKTGFLPDLEIERFGF